MTRSNRASSITAAATTEPFWLQAARGQIYGHTPYNANGYNSAVGTTEEGVWTNGGTINWLSSASTLNITSSSANDDLVGTGARTLTIWGLDANWEEQTETVDMDGQTIVNTLNTYIRVHRAKVETFGSGATNAGVIYVFTGAATSGVPDTATQIYTTIDTGEGESLQAFYTVPANHTGYILDISLGNFVAADEYCAFRLQYREAANSGAAGWTTLEKLDIDTQFYLLYSCPVYVEEMTDIMITAAAQTTSNRVGASFNIVTIQDVMP